MAINFSQKRKKQNFLVLIFFILIVAIFIILWQGRLAKIKIAVPQKSTPQLPTIEINYELLKGSFLKDLKLFEDIKSFEGQAGRENPFIPY